MGIGGGIVARDYQLKHLLNCSTQSDMYSPNHFSLPCFTNKATVSLSNSCKGINVVLIVVQIRFVTVLNFLIRYTNVDTVIPNKGLCIYY